MNTRVITVSRQLGSEGGEVARTVARELGFGYLDRDIIQRAAEEAGVDPELVSDAERAQPLRKRILEAIAVNPGLATLGWPDICTPPPLLQTSAHYRKLVEDVIRDAALEGNVVIRGHAGQVILKDRWDTLKVLVIGSPRLRALRVAERRGTNVDEAERLVADSDRERHAFFERAYNVRWLSPELYDLCLNTDHVRVCEAIDLVLRAAAAR